MTFLPIVGRELREASRRKSTYWIRIQAAAVALIIGVLFLLSEMRGMPHILGKALFVVLAGFTLLQALLAGAWRTSDCISEEKREGTLGLLFLTDLKGYDIVLGKLAATSLNVFYALLAVIPVMAIPILMGGVTLDAFLRVTLAALNNLFFSLAVGMFFSAVSRDERKAMSAAFLFLLSVTVVVPAVVLLVGAARNWVETPWWVMMVSPAFFSVLAFESVWTGFGGGGNPHWFWQSMATVHVMGWVLLGVACFHIPRSWQETGRREAAPQDSGEPHARDSRREFRRRLLERNPFTWLAVRGPGKFRLVWMFLGLCALLWLWGWSEMKGDWTSEPTYILTAIAVHTVLKLWVVTESARRLQMDRRSGALELLLSTPLSVRQMVGGQLGALWRQFAAPVGLVVVVDVLFLLDRLDQADFVWVFAVGIVSFLADLVALAWVGMWMGLRATSVNRAAAATVLRVLVLPWAVFWVSMTLAAVLGIFSNGRFEEELAFLYWLALSLGANVIFALAARKGLLHRFRETASAVR